MNSVFKQIWNQIRLRIVGALFAALVFCAPALWFFWGFDLIYELRAKVVLSVLVGVVPMLMALAEPRSWWDRWKSLWFALIFVPLLLLAIGDKFDMPVLRINAALLIIALLGGWWIWPLMGRNWLLLAGMVPAAIAAMIYWIAAMVQNEASWDVTLLPLPTIAVIIAAWTPIGRAALHYARRWKYKRLRGPGLQALAMVVLFLPTILMAMLVPWALGMNGTWSSISLALLGVLLSAVISEPLRRFLLRWGSLSGDE